MVADVVEQVKKFTNLKNSVFQFFLYLGFFVILSQFDLLNGTQNTSLKFGFMQNQLLQVTTAVILWYITVFRMGITKANPYNLLITSMIIYVLLNPTNPLLFFPLTLTIAWLGKYFIQYSNMPIFNPAGLGIFLTFYLTKVLTNVGLLPDTLLVSWWGADMQQQFLSNTQYLNVIVPVLLLGGFLYFADKFKKLTYVSSFFMTFGLLLYLFEFLSSGTPSDAFSFLANSFVNSFAFFTLVMLPEPKTSPSLTKQQVAIGSMTGAVLFLFLVYLPDQNNLFVGLPFITTLLVANILTYFFKKEKILFPNNS